MARPSFRALFAGRRLKCAYVGSGLQLFIAGALPAWLPTYFVRYYDLPLKDAASRAGLFLAIGGVGMVICGMISDRVVHGTARRAMLSALYCVGCALLLSAALWFGPGVPQLVLLGAAMFLAAATAGPAGAMVANLTPAALHGTAFAILSLANNALGQAPGPIVTGWLADRIGLLGALQWLPLASMCAAVVFFIGARRFETVSPSRRAGMRALQVKPVTALIGVGPGLLASILIAAAAGLAASLTGGPVMLFALLLGIAMNFLGKVERCDPGIAFTSKSVLRLLASRFSA